MVTICLLIIIGTLLYSYYQKTQKEKQQPESKAKPESQLEQKPQPEPKPAQKPAPKPEPKRPSNVIWEDSSNLLSFEPDGLSLNHNGKIYRFSGDGHEPMAIILHCGEAVAYIHNSFDIEYECRQFRRNPDYKCTTITGRQHDAKHFCLLLTTAIDHGYDWQIDELESRMDELTRYDSREIWYREDGIEFGRYGNDSGEREQHHYEHEILYIIVDGHKYHLNDNVNEPNALYLFWPGGYGRRQAVLRIHGTNGAVLAAYADDWKSGHTFTPFGRPCDTKTFCAMIAYALRSGKKDFNLRELEKAITNPQEEKIDKIIYEDDNCRLYLADNVAHLIYLGHEYSFGFDGRQPFATICGNGAYVIIRQMDNIDNDCRFFAKNPEGKVSTITGRTLNAQEYCKLLCAAVHGINGDRDRYIDDLERQVYELERYREYRKKMDEELKARSKYIYFSYSRESVCAADDYTNKSLKFELLDYATLEELITYITNYHEEAGYAAIPYTGGDARWCITSDDRELAEVTDSGRILSFFSYAPDIRLLDLFSSYPESSVASPISLRGFSLE